MEQTAQKVDGREIWGQLLPIGTKDQAPLKLSELSECLRATDKYDSLEIVSLPNSKEENKIYCELSCHHVGKDSNENHVFLLTNETLASKTEDILINGVNVLDCIEHDFQQTGTTKKGLKLSSGDTITFQTLHDTFTKQISFVFLHQKDLVPDLPKELEALLHNYYLLEQIGVERDSVVNVVIHKYSGIKFAAKIIKNNSVQKFLEEIKDSSQNESSGKDIEQANNSTGELWKSIEHPNIVGLHEIVKSDNYLCYIMELMDGDLLNYLNDYGPLSEHKASLIFYQILDALHYLHSKFIIHRDVKPQNILFCKQGKDTVKLSDFGLSC
eukprot:TRINITY_DN7927_c0_g1_i1.p1 TRINITY_DN7927_c0_g1~~TRINITY_DN7927_c0_g1_i1.p1  ORF type:complete len:337 (-),score=62.79 TRINITY_DN7927_c0_g1_i1:501-1481(-)